MFVADSRNFAGAFDETPPQKEKGRGKKGRGKEGRGKG